MTFSNPTLWNAIGFWVLVAGLFGAALALFLLPTYARKAAAIISLALVIGSVTVQYAANKQGVGPRHLTPAQEKKLVSKLQRFAGAGIEIAAYRGNSETRRVGDQIAKTLQMAKWSVREDPTREPQWAVDGILVELTKTDAWDERAAKALVSALTKVQLAASGPLTAEGSSQAQTSKTDPSNDKPIRLIIGRNSLSLAAW